MELGLPLLQKCEPLADSLTGSRSLAGWLEEFCRFNVKDGRKFANYFQTYVSNAPFHLAHVSAVDSCQMG